MVYLLTHVIIWIQLRPRHTASRRSGFLGPAASASCRRSTGVACAGSPPASVRPTPWRYKLITPGKCQSFIRHCYQAVLGRAAVVLNGNTASNCDAHTAVGGPAKQGS